MRKKNRITAISYSDNNYSMSKKLNLFTARLIGGADRTISYSPEDLDESYKKRITRGCKKKICY